MNLSSLSVILAQATSSPAAAPATGSGQQTVQDPRAGTANMMLLIGVMCVAMYLLVFRPQNKKAKELENMLKTVKPGDKVVTTSGIVGTVVALKDKTLSLRSADTKMEVLKSSVTEITERGGESSGAAKAE